MPRLQAARDPEDARPARRTTTIATIDDLLAQVDSKYTLVHLAARRAREINNYYHSLGEGLGQFTPPLVDHSSNKPLSIALEEIAARKIVVQYTGDAARVAEELLGQQPSDEGDDAEVLELTAEDLYDEEPTPPEPLDEA